MDCEVEVTRGPVVESRHRVHVAVVDAEGQLRAHAGDPERITFFRSAAKPLQAVPLVEDGAYDRYGLTLEELALCCGSHSGSAAHTKVAERILEKAAVTADALACGAHPPMDADAARELEEAGLAPGRLHNNCSGKHAAMLARANVGGWPAEGYERDDHPVQRGALTEVARWTGVPEDGIIRAVDGCGVVVFGLPLDAMARAYARLASAVARGEEIPTRITRAIATRPFLFGGTERFDSLLVEETGGRVISKIGAEGVHSVVAFEQRVGFAVKVEDGATRAQYPAVLHLLQLLGALPERLSPRLAEYARPRIRNTRGEMVGELIRANA